MDERDCAGRFSQDVDRLLREAGRADGDELPPAADYQEVVRLAHRLASTDFSGESRVRSELRRRLLKQVQAGSAGKKGRAARPWMPAGLRPRRTALAVGAVLLAALLVAGLVWPGALATAGQAIRQLVQSLRVGSHTEIQQVKPTPPEEGPGTSRPQEPEVIRSNDHWHLRTSIGNFGGSIARNEPETIHEIKTFEEAEAIAGRWLGQPRVLPQGGYRLREAIVAPGNWTFLFYDGPEGELVLAQIPVYDREERLAEDVSVVSSAGVGVMTDKPVEQVTLNGRPAAWIEDYGLVWEADGVSYVLGGAHLSLDEALRVAGSVGE